MSRGMRSLALCALLGAGQVAAVGMCAQGDVDVDFSGGKPPGTAVNGPTVSTPGLDLSQIHDNLQGTTVFVPLGPFPLAGGETVTVGCCAAGGCEVIVAAYTCWPCSAGRNGMIPSTLRSLGYEHSACGARFGQAERERMNSFRGFVEAGGPPLTFVLDGPTEGMAIFTRPAPAGVSLPVSLPQTQTGELVHAIAVEGGTNVQITSSGSLTYTPTGPMADGMRVWGDRTYVLGSVPVELQSATYFRPSHVKHIPAGTTITVSGQNVGTVYVMMEVHRNRHGNFPTTLPQNGWTHVLQGKSPQWMETANTGYDMDVYKLDINGRIPTSEWCPRRSTGPSPPCDCPAPIP